MGGTAADETAPSPPAADQRLARTGTAGGDAAHLLLVHALAQNLADQVSVLVTDACAGRGEVPLTVHPALLTSIALEALTKPDAREETPVLRAIRLRQIAHGLRWAADLLGDLAADDHPRYRPPAPRL